MIRYFGVRHLSPSGGYHVTRFLDKYNPSIVLIEGPSDLSSLIGDICNSKNKFPIAMLAYTSSIPIETIIYPLAEYSPEYQAMLWAYKNNKQCRFIDLPSGVFLSLKQLKSNTAQYGNVKDVYEKLEEILNEDTDSYFERRFEHNLEEDSYEKNVYEYGKQLRMVTRDSEFDVAENTLREAYMIHNIDKAQEEVGEEADVAVITGAFHVEGLKSLSAMSETEIKQLREVETNYTLMPYSYYRLSKISGYGAGNKAPNYYEILWNNIKKGKVEDTAYEYLSEIADFQRKNGGITSSAEVIEAVRLSFTLASFRNSKYPSLSDLKDAAKTCIGHGNLAEVSMAMAKIEIGDKVGRLPKGVSNTSIQKDFYSQLKDLKLEKYQTLTMQTLDLDLRENRRVKSEKAAFLDLERSFFLHRLEVLNINFAESVTVNQENASWAESFNLRWTPETEIEIVEAALKGDTIELATGYVFKEMLDKCQSIADASKVISLANLCGMPKVVEYATKVLQGLSIDSSVITEIGITCYNLSSILKYGTIRKLDNSALIPILKQLILRACLIAVDNSKCDKDAIKEVVKNIGYINEVVLNHDFIDEEAWLNTLDDMANRDDINTKASGYAAAILLERGRISSEKLSVMMERRLKKGIPSDLGAEWFEGLSMKNRYTLISRMSLWEKLSEYIDSLDDEEFKRALVFLRRAFSDFSAKEKCSIGENLGEIWNLNKDKVSEIVNTELTKEQEEEINNLDDFDFDDF